MNDNGKDGIDGMNVRIQNYVFPYQGLVNFCAYEISDNRNQISKEYYSAVGASLFKASKSPIRGWAANASNQLGISIWIKSNELQSHY